MDIGILVGKTLKEAIATSDSVTFTTDTGERYMMNHVQDCCESVYIECIIGDLQDLVGEPILVAEEVSSYDDAFKEDIIFTASDGSESCTWTFYKLATKKGYVDIRWLGESSGYYSESVDFDKI